MNQLEQVYISSINFIQSIGIWWTTIFLMDYFCKHFIRLCFLILAIVGGFIYHEHVHREDSVTSGWKPWVCARLITVAEQHIVCIFNAITFFSLIS